MGNNSTSPEMFFEVVKSNKFDAALEMLKLKEIDINSRDTKSHGQTALHIAAKNGYEDLVKLIVNDYNADINIKDNRGETPLMVACDNYHPNIAKFLVEHAPDDADYAKIILNEKPVDDLFEAVEKNDITKVSEILDQKIVEVNVIDKSKHNRSILQAAARQGHEELVRLLVEKYNANIQWSDDIGDLSVHMAADNGHIGVVKYLVDKGSRHAEDVEHLL